MLSVLPSFPRDFFLFPFGGKALFWGTVFPEEEPDPVLLELVVDFGDNMFNFPELGAGLVLGLLDDGDDMVFRNFLTDNCEV